MSRLLNLDSPFYRAYSAAADLVIVNVLTLLGCLPVVTAGASLTACARVVADMVREEEGYVLRTWWRAFSGALRQSLGWWLPLLGLLALGLWEARLLGSTTSATVGGGLSGLLLAGLVVLLGVLVWLVPLSAVFDNTLPAHLSNALRLAVGRLDLTVACLLVLAAPVTLAWLAPDAWAPLAWFTVFLGVAFGAYLIALLQRGVMDRLRGGSEIV
ncbi:Predicted integral membrane protein [Actinomyces bovis]|uniref:Predicted integral membrane protein n=1 Tax=Actinomyces bovis TaxID=1658 RepID=A0ABY1VPB4_9ACTO|nr:DUF624 domain-containing protein [Actinomyces bovis]SPT53557.1 Predicted integral membrane protein [Actinomyces bovis]VEG55535.1 Predicted integral membrane protein [Actinomyces israelii]